MNKMFHMHYHRGLDIKPKIRIAAFLKFIFKKRSLNARYQTSVHPSCPWERRKERLSKAVMMWQSWCTEGKEAMCRSRHDGSFRWDQPSGWVTRTSTAKTACHCD